MFPDLAIRFKNYAADMGSGFVVIAGFLLAITMVFVMVFAHWTGVKNSSSTFDFYGNTHVETTSEDTVQVSLVMTDPDQ